MISIVADEGGQELHQKALARLLKGEVGPVRIASAYVGHQALVGIKAPETRLMFSLSHMDLVCGATSLNALSLLLDSGVECRYVSGSPKLHAKVYLFGDRAGLITSANLTGLGLTSNVEVGVVIQGEPLKTLAAWYEALWRRRAEPVTEKLIARLRHETATLRREFRVLQERLRKESAVSFRPLPSKRALVEPPTVLEALFVSAKRIFICNTNRRDRKYTSTGSFLFEELMHKQSFAAAWEAFDYSKRMEEVKKGDAILMFAKGVGIIGIGKATGPCETLRPGELSRLYASEYTEWRVPVTWLVWCDEEDAFPWSESPNKTFFDASGESYGDFRRNLRNHFLAD